jgi:hypothetical protein
VRCAMELYGIPCGAATFATSSVGYVNRGRVSSNAEERDARIFAGCARLQKMAFAKRPFQSNVSALKGPTPRPENAS